MTNSSLTLKTSLSPITTITLSSPDQSHLEENIRALVQEAPHLFNGLPCVVDVASLECDLAIFSLLISKIRASGLSVIGARNLSPELKESLADLTLADFGHSSKAAPRASGDAAPKQSEVKEEDAEADEEVPAVSSEAEKNPPEMVTKVVQDNIRSGRHLHFDGNLIIQGMVSAGAEVLATGSIQVFGALRGKAMAGIEGDTSATISCAKFHAELVSIARRYQVFDESQYDGLPVVVLLEDDKLSLHGPDH